jgi:hypothetical protein
MKESEQKEMYTESHDKRQEEMDSGRLKESKKQIRKRE